MTVSLNDTWNMGDEAVERAKNLSAQLAGSVRREDASKLEPAATKNDLARTCVECANLQWSANSLVAKKRDAFADLRGALQAAVKSSNHWSGDVFDKVKVEMGEVWKRMMSSLDMEYPGALRRIRASVVRNDNGFLRNFVCCTALISTRLRNSDTHFL